MCPRLSKLQPATFLRQFFHPGLVSDGGHHDHDHDHDDHDGGGGDDHDYGDHDHGGHGDHDGDDNVDCFSTAILPPEPGQCS